ncbi:MAG: FAD-dependent oxidoreductase, partial [Clostridia bacterium]|nr:FAD-dependent oxidoreductase [Clostridia bacterium]
DKMTASDEERAWAVEEGVQLHNSKTFKEIVGEDGHVTGMAIAGVLSFRFEVDGRSVIELEPDSDELIPCDTVIFAIGQRPDIGEAFGLRLNRGRIEVDDGLRTDVEGVFAAGDAVYGTASVIKAIAAGRLAAERIDQYLGGDGDIAETLAPEQHRCPYIGAVDDFAGLPREEARVLPAAERIHGFAPMDLGLDEHAAHCEASRCLQCDLRLDIAPQRFWSSFTQSGENEGGEAE